MATKKFFTLLLFLFSVEALCQNFEFQHLKLKGKLKKRASQLEKNLKSQSRGLKSLGKNQKFTDSPDTSPIIEEVLEILGGQYEKIGKSQTDELIKNHNLGGGVLNFSGFTWYKPMLNYNISANREVAPELFSDRWIVHDTFSIFIEAATLLSNLKETDQIDISDTAIGAFSGVTFTRTYHYYHFADTYIDGLTSDYSKLFLSFLKFKPEASLSLDPYEVIKKSDQFTFNAGGVVKAPVGNGFNLQAGALVKKSFSTNLMVQGLGPLDSPKENEIIRLSLDKKTDITAGAHLSLQYDFFNLLQLTLLSYDLDYTYGKANKVYLSFYQEDKEILKNSSSHNSELKSILKGKDKVQYWENNIVGQEKRIKEDFNSKFSFLLFGNMKKRATEQIKIIKDGIEKVFFKHYSESITYIQSWLSKVYSVVIEKIFDFSPNVQNRSEIRKQMTIEYEHLKHLNSATVEDEKDFSIRLKTYFQVAETHKWYQKRNKKSALSYLKNTTNLDSNLQRKVDKKELRGPLIINSIVEIEEEGLRYLNHLSTHEVTQAAVEVCGVKSSEYRKGKFVKKRRRRGRFVKRSLSSAQKCALKIIERFEDYIQEYDQWGSINLLKLKRFLGYYYSKTKNLNHLIALFGHDHLFIHGDFQAKTKSGKNFQTFFKSGQFKGLGVIDKFKNETLVVPIDTK